MANKKHKAAKAVSMYVKQFNNHDVLGHSAEMGFYLLTALFPFMILLFVIATLISDSMQNLLLNLLTFLPRDLEIMITELLLSFKGSLPIIITASVFGLWYTSNVISTLTKAMNKFYAVKETRGFFKLRGMFLLFALFIIILIILSFSLIIFSQGTHFIVLKIDFFDFFDTEKIWDYSRYIVILFVIFITIALMFKTLPNKKLSFKAVALGSLLTTIAWCVTSLGFSYYVNSFSRYHVIYGSLASIIILTTWVYLSSLVILAGGSINAFFYKIRLAKKITNAQIQDYKDLT